MALPVKGIPAKWMDWGGRRPGAGRRKRTEQRVQIWPWVKVETQQKLNKKSFDKNKTTGEVIDELLEEKPVDTRKKKK